MPKSVLLALTALLWCCWVSAESRLPELDFTVVHSSGVTYGLHALQGVWVSTDSGQTWVARNDGLPRKVVYPFDTNPLRRITSLAVDPLNGDRVAVTTAHGLHVSEDHGLTWREINTTKPEPGVQGWPKGSSYFTSVALFPGSTTRFLLGTSYNGFFETVDDGATWTDPSEHALFLSRGAGFFEEIAAAAYYPPHAGVFAFGCGFGHSVYYSSPDHRSYTDLLFPGATLGETIRAMLWVPASSGEGQYALRVTTDRGEWYYTPELSTWVRTDSPAPIPPHSSPNLTVARDTRATAASAKTGIYLNSYQARGERLVSHMEWLRAQGLNSVVVDFKDDYGHITYDTKVEQAHRMGAVRNRIDLDDLLRAARETGVYVIGRLIVFKDQTLYEYDEYRYAAWDRLRDEPWRYLKKYVDEDSEETRLVQKEHWVDPYSPDVWNYTIAIARELQSRGVNEIQFDYIRFPTDGDLSTITYRHRRPGMSRIDALESFLILARKELAVPISTDLYGFNSWHRMGNWNGQSIEMVSDYVDVISPMFYPNHFPIQFLSGNDYLTRARQIYAEGCDRTAQIVGGRAIVRPYVQAFLMTAVELAMEYPQYTSLLAMQLDGTAASPASGFTLWNPSNRYYMVGGSLEEYTTLFAGRLEEHVSGKTQPPPGNPSAP